VITVSQLAGATHVVRVAFAATHDPIDVSSATSPMGIDQRLERYPSPSHIDVSELLQAK
jgi:hypothetical protein